MRRTSKSADKLVRSSRHTGAGRPRQFDKDRALERAMHLFWRKGYDGTSLTDLTKAMKISPPSLYAAFGGKQALFRAALDRYQQMEAALYVDDALRQPTARAVVERLLRGAAAAQTDPRHPGCLMVQGALVGRTTDAAIRNDVQRRRARGQAIVLKRLTLAQATGDLPASADARALARFVVAVIRGMAVEAAGGASRDDLEEVIVTALRSWPAKGA